MRTLLFTLLLFALSAHGEEEAAATSAIDERISLEWQVRDNPFVITPHRPSYILPLTYNANPNRDPYQNVDPDLAPVSNEVKFQFSFKVPLVEDVLFGRGLLSFGYTQQSFWQAYRSDASSPFRENNYEPEILLNFPINKRALGLDWRLVGLALNHQSNGRSEPLSRSWNRVMLELVAERDNFYLSLKPWWRIPNTDGDDDNPDIERYMGNFELRGLTIQQNHTFGFMLRNNLSRDNYGALQLDYTFKLNRRLRGYLQIFHGYGDSLIDYDHRSNSIGVGVMLTNWL
ncbi:MAG: phospholipase A [Pseudomonadota bacterium]